MRADTSAWLDFLRIEADLAMTFIRLAGSYSNPKDTARALENARKALEQIQRGLANPVGFELEDIAFLEQCCRKIESALSVPPLHG
jgi:hypothetical protein